MECGAIAPLLEAMTEGVAGRVSRALDQVSSAFPLRVSDAPPHTFPAKSGAAAPHSILALMT